MAIQFRNVGTVLALAGVAAGSLGFFVAILLTSWIWIPLILIFSPLLIGAYFLFKGTSVGAYGQNIWTKFYYFAFYRSESMRRFLWQEFYNFICWLYPQVQWKVMNYGYAVFNSDGKLINNMSPEFEVERFPLQLYHYIATSLGEIQSLQGKKVLEVSSGRGGGLNYISKTLKPTKCVGIDLSQNQIEFCKRAYVDNPNIEFFEGDSEELTENPNLKEEKFDLIINIESSHCYANNQEFVKGVDRLLKSGGTFVFADFRQSNDIQKLEKELQSLNMKLLKKEDITVNVLHALKLDENRRLALIDGFVHKWLQPLFKKFNGLKGSRIIEAMESREIVYMAYVLKKVD